jgi:hypothetical protein
MARCLQAGCKQDTLALSGYCADHGDRRGMWEPGYAPPRLDEVVDRGPAGVGRENNDPESRTVRLD